MIRVQDLCFRYAAASQNEGLHGVNLHISPGEVIVIVGRSGSGKTTLARALNGLIPHYYEGEMSGCVSVEGRMLKEMEMAEISRRVGSVFQNPRSQFFNLDTIAEVAFGLENYGEDVAQLRETVAQTVRELGIESLMGCSIFELSGGQKQIIAIAAAYALGPDVFIMDEPSANLDYEATGLLGRLVARLKEQGKTVVVSEHRTYYLESVLDRCLYLENGMLTREISHDDYVNMGANERAGLGLRSLDLSRLELPACAQAINPPACACPLSASTLEVRDLTARYKRHEVLHGVNLAVPSGSTTCLIGRNGAGKTTLATVMCGLMRESGGAIVLGKALRPRQRVGRFYLIMQETADQLFSDTVLGELRLSATSQYDDERLLDILVSLSLEEFADRHPLSLSGGQKQRLAIATALVADAEVVVLDEPTSGLDYCGMQRVCSVISQIKAQGAHVIVITHDYEFMLQAADRVAVLEDGLIQCDVPLNAEHFDQVRAWFSLDERRPAI